MFSSLKNGTGRCPEGAGPKIKPRCMECKQPFAPARRKAGYNVCLDCGDKAATRERKGWCVVQEYGKGGYMFITPEAAPTTLKQTNQKHIRT